MKKHLILLLAFIVMLISSCQKDANLDQGVGQDGMVDFSITTSLPKGPDAYTRAGTAPTDSALGGLANVDKATYNLRYIMEVWTIGNSPKRVYREVKTADTSWETAVTFDARLIAQKYNFVFWADFVLKSAGKVDLHYNTTTTTGLNNIEFSTTSGGYKVSDDTRDAYFHRGEIDLSVSTNKFAVSLKRPFAKVRFIATDRPQNDANNHVSSSTIDYSNTEFYKAFNATTGLATGERAVRTTEELTKLLPTAEGVEGNYLLVFDYILPANDFASIGESNITTTIDGVEASRPNLPAIPIVANTLVTLKGNLYTNRGDVTVNVTEAFDATDEVPVEDIIIQGELVKQTVESVENVNESIERLIKAATVVEGSPVIEVIVTEAVATDAEVSIPAAGAATNITAITYDFSAGIASGQTLTIGETTNDYAGTINVIVPEANAGSVIINAPSAHVTINGKYTTLTAATSATTLVIEAGAIIETLTVTKGNVVIHGDVTTLVNTGGGTVIEHVTTSVGLTKALGRDIAIEIQLADGTYYSTYNRKKTFNRYSDLKMIGATKGGVIINNIFLSFEAEYRTGNWLKVSPDLEVQNIIFNDSKPSIYSSTIMQNSYSSQLIVKNCEFNVSGSGSNNSASIYTKSGRFDIDNCKFTNNETVNQPYAIYCLVNDDSEQTPIQSPIKSRITNTTFETNATFATVTDGTTKNNSTAIYIKCSSNADEVLDYIIDNCTINNYYYAISSVESNSDFGAGSKIAISNVTMNNWYNIWTYSSNVTWNISNSTLNAVNPHNAAGSDNGNIHIQDAKIEMNFTNVKMSTKSTGSGNEPSRIYPFRIRMDKTQPAGNIVTLNFIGSENTITESGNITSGTDTWRPNYMIHEAGYRRMTEVDNFDTLYPNVSNRITVSGAPAIAGVTGATLRNENIFGDEFILFNNEAYQTYLLGLAELNVDGDNMISVVEAASFTGTITRPTGAVALNALRVENFFPNATKN